MVFGLIVFCLSVLGLFLFLTWKAPLVADLSEKENDKGDFILSAKEKLEEGIKKEVEEKFENFLQRVLSVIRKGIIKVEALTTKWLYTLKRKRKKKEE